MAQDRSYQGYHKVHREVLPPVQNNESSSADFSQQQWQWKSIFNCGKEQNEAESKHEHKNIKFSDGT